MYLWQVYVFMILVPEDVGILVYVVSCNLTLCLINAVGSVMHAVWGLKCQKPVSSTWISNYIPLNTLGYDYPYPWYLFLAPKSNIYNIMFHTVAVWQYCKVKTYIQIWSPNRCPICQWLSCKTAYALELLQSCSKPMMSSSQMKHRVSIVSILEVQSGAIITMTS